MSVVPAMGQVQSVPEISEEAKRVVARATDMPLAQNLAELLDGVGVVEHFVVGFAGQHVRLG